MHRFRDGMISRTRVKDTIHTQASHRRIAANGATTRALLLTALRTAAKRYETRSIAATVRGIRCLGC